MNQSTLHMPEFAPVVALAFLGAGLLLFGAVIGTATSLAFRRTRVARWIAGGGLLVAGVYAAALFAASLLTPDRTLSAGGRKVFCEIDCHLAYSVAGIERVGEGRFLAVTVRTWFDESSIAPWRGNAPLAPNPRVVYLIDAAGRRIEPSAAGQRAYESERGPTMPLSRPLSPGQSYATTFVFEAPGGLPGLRLFVGDPPGVDGLLIGHENSPMHGKIYFALDSKAS